MKQGVVNIRGREYQTVALRVHNFREEYPDWTIETELIDRDEKYVVMRCRILSEAGRLIGSGYAEERRDSSQINQTSALENAETSAIGRALASIGLAGTEYASANEVQNAIHQQASKAVTPSAGVEDSLDAGRIATLTAYAQEIIEAWNRGGAEDATNLWDSVFGPDKEAIHEEKIFAWKQLPSHICTHIKKLQKEMKNAAA